MTNKLGIDGYALAIEEIFEFADRRKILVVRLVSGAPTVLAPADVELIVDGNSHGMIRLDAERMPGPGSRELRAVETHAELPVESLRGRACTLVRR